MRAGGKRGTVIGSAVAASGLILAGVILMLAPAPAIASQAYISSGDLKYTAAPGETNTLSVSLSGTNYIFDDPGATITVLAPCATVTATRVACPQAGVETIEVDVGNMNDQVVVGTSVPELQDGGSLQGGDGADTITNQSSYEMRTFGGIGNDVISGGSSGDRLEGEDGSDTLSGNGGGDQLLPGPGNDTVNGGDGSDSLDGGDVPDGSDSFSGGPGYDDVSYQSRNAALAVTLDGVANDGEAGEKDNIGADVESIEGGSVADSLSGSDADNDIEGNGGNDVVTGGGGADDLSGGPGDDSVSGGSGNDYLAGDQGADVISGDEGDDQFYGEFYDDTPDILKGGAGIDTYLDGTFLGMTVSLDGVANDGFLNADEGPAVDNVGEDFENIESHGNAPDTLIGNGSANQIDGSAGNDTISGLGGPDSLIGGLGNDTLDAGAGPDGIQGGGGSDSIRSRDSNADEVECGSSADTLLADSLDDVSVTCEKSSAGAFLNTSGVKLSRKGTGKVKVTCPAAEEVTCKVKVTAVSGKKTLATAAGRVKPGKAAKLTIRLTKAGKKKNGGKLRTTAKTTLTDAAGAKVTTSRKLVLK